MKKWKFLKDAALISTLVAAPLTAPVILNSCNQVTNSNKTVAASNSLLKNDLNNNDVKLSLIDQKYAWKKAEAYSSTIQGLSCLDTEITNFEECQKHHWDVSASKFESSDNYVGQDFTIKQNHTANNNCRAILMQFEISSTVAAHSTNEYISEIILNGNLKFNKPGLFQGCGRGAVEWEFSEISDTRDCNIKTGRIWNNHEDGVEFDDDAECKKFNVDYKHLMLASSAQGKQFNFNDCVNQKIKFVNDSDETKQIKKYLNFYILTSAWENAGVNHKIVDTTLSFKIAKTVAPKILNVKQTPYCGIQKIDKWDENHFDDEEKRIFHYKNANTQFMVNDLLKSKEPVANQWKSKMEYDIASLNCINFNANFSMKKGTRDYKKALFWTTEILLELPAHSNVTIYLDDINFDLNARVKGKTCSTINYGSWGIGVSRLYQNENCHPNEYIGDKDIKVMSELAIDEINSGKGKGVLPQYGSFEDYNETTLPDQKDCVIKDCGENPSGGIQYVYADYSSWGKWCGRHLTNNSNLPYDDNHATTEGRKEVDIKHCDNNLTKTKRSITVWNPHGVTMREAVYFDSWIIASPLGSQTHWTDLPISLDDSFLKYSIKFM